MAGSASLQLALLVLPAVVLVLYLLTSFPHAPESMIIHPSLASLPRHSRSWSIYPEDIYDGGAYVAFPYGKVRYWLFGPEDGIKIVLIHGLSVPSLVWNDIAPQLAESGFRVLLYDLYGRGYSDAPQTTYDVTLYTTQLALLLQYVGWHKTNLVGVSMGGAIAASFAVQFPHLTTGNVALIATAGIVNSGDMSRTSRFLSSPLMQIVTSSYPFRMYLQHLASNTSIIDDPVSELVRIQSAHLSGYNPAIASSIRDGPLRSLAPAFVALGRQTRKSGGRVLIFWGTEDRIMPYRYAARVQTLISGSALVTLEGAGHDLTATRAGEITGELVKLFAGQ